MQACFIDRYGGPDALRVAERPIPAPRAGQVLLEVRAAGLNPVDYKTREGQARRRLPYRLPLVLGNEHCGEIVSVAERVAGFAAGQRVPAWLRWLFAFLTRRERALARSRGVRFRYGFMRPDGAQLRELMARVADGRLRVIAEAGDGIAAFPQAFAALESGRTVGERVVRIAGR